MMSLSLTGSEGAIHLAARNNNMGGMFMQKIKNIFYLFLFFAVILSIVQPESVFGQDFQNYTKEELKRAEKEYRAQLKENSDNVEALNNLVHVLMERKDWGAVEFWAPGLIKKAPDNVFANYAYAVCKRELGKSRPPILRMLAFNKSEKYFKKVVKMDSLYKDVYYQWGLLERIKERYIHAVELIRKQMRIKPENDNYKYEIFHFYDYLVAHVPPDSVEPYLLNRSDSYSRYALGELYRRRGLLDAADSLFCRLLNSHDEMEIQPVYLSLVRINVAREKYEEAEKYYWLAVDSISTKAGADLVVEDFMYIINPEEYRAVKSYKSFAELRRIIHYVWVKRNLMPAMKYNSRLIEHYQRLIVAEKNYRYDGLRHKLQKSDTVNQIKFPVWYYENYKFNDMGLIYIRYGEPDDRVTTFGNGVLSNISWLYRERPDRGKLIFHFYIAPDAPPGYWTLKPIIATVGELEKLYEWDPVYYLIAPSASRVTDRVKKMSIDRISSVSIESFKSKIIEERVRDVDFAMKHDEQRFSKSTTVLPLSFVANRFLTPDLNYEIQFAYAIPADQIFKKAGKDSLTLETGITVFDKYMKEVYKDLKDYKLIKSGKERHIYKKKFIDKFSFKVSPDKYNIAIHCRIPKTDQVNGSRFSYTVTQKDTASLALSSLLLAYDISFKTASEKRSRENLDIIPNPSLRFSKKEPLFVYYEIYNLMKDSSGRTRYTVVFNIKQKGGGKRTAGNIFGVLGKTKPYTVSVKNTYSGKWAKESNFLSFDVSRAAKGDYTLEIVVYDTIANIQKKETTEFILN